MRHCWTRLSALTAVCLAGMMLSAAPAVAATGSPGQPGSPGQAWPVPATAAPAGPAASIGGTGPGGGSSGDHVSADTAPADGGPAGSDPAASDPAASDSAASDSADRASAAAAVRARETGHPQQVAALTTGTSTLTVAPDGIRTLRVNVLPVRVREHDRWAAVDTRLARTAGGMLAPAAIPGDAVAFSPGGAGPMAVISAKGASLALWWPGRLPAPAVSGSSAAYRDVLPGVDLVLTATSTASGGFTDALVVRTAAAARDPRLARLALRVTTRRARLRSAPGGGLSAPLTVAGQAGAFTAPAPQMWDSSRARPGTAAARQAGSAARAVGAGLAGWGTGPLSSAAGPAGGARLAQVRAAVSGGGSVMSLVPDQRMLNSPSTKFPVFIDPSFNYVSKTGTEQAYDPVQSGSGCTGSHYNSPSYKFSPVGYDNFQQGQCEYNDTDYALYRVGIPSQIYPSNANLLTASFQVSEVYSSSCSTDPNMMVSWIGAIGSGTGWPGPGKVNGETDETTHIGADSGSCNGTEDTSKRVNAGFNEKPNLEKLSSATNITFRLWESGDTNDADHKQFTDNPDLVVQYNDTPNTPSGEEENSTSGTTGAIKCDTSSSNPPAMGATASTNGPYLLASYSDDDGDSLQANVQYWNNASPSTKYTLHADMNSGNAAAVQIPASFTSKMANGTVIGWQAQAQDGSSGGYGPYTSAWSQACYFAVYPTAPDPPTVTGSAGSAAVGSPVTFTITQSGGDAASKFVWELDNTPPASGAPAGQTCTTSSATSPNCVISGGTATLQITIPSPGPHDLWVYEQDAASNSSGTGMATVDGDSDPPVSYVSGSSLSANFADALTDKQSYDNTMISSSSGTSCGATAGDGTGTQFRAADLTAAGWPAGGHVTVNGTGFTVPAFGSCAADNLLAANQTIGAGPQGAQGSALVFLATSSDAFADVPGLMTGSPDTDNSSLQQDVTTPGVTGGTRVTGSGCSGSVELDANQDCGPATGTISYASASGCPAAPVPYTLTVPDWWTGPADIAAATLPNIIKSTGESAKTVKIYAFSVPVDPACAVASVTLPDVGASSSVQLTGGTTGVSQSEPALHIFGLSMRNTSTATPMAGGTAQAAPSGQAWTGAFESPIEDAFAPPAGSTWGNQTVRVAVSPNVTAQAGAQVRIRLSDPGFLSADGTGPLQIGAATIARQSSGPKPVSGPVALAFGGSTSVTIPEGGDVYSDPMSFPVTTGKGLLLSLWIKNSSLPVLPLNDASSGASTWFAPSSTPNETTDATGTPFTGSGSTWLGAVPLVTGLDVTTPAATLNGTSSPGAPTVIVAGNNVIDGQSSSALSDALSEPSKRLAGQLAAQAASAGYGVVDAGIQSNQVLADGSGAGGVSLVARLDRDVLAEPDIGTVIIDEGLQDLLAQGSAASDTTLENALTAVETQLGGSGINVITGTLTPCDPYANSTAKDTCDTSTTSGADVDAARTAVNENIVSGGDAPNCPADFDGAVSNGGSTEQLATSPTDFDAGDHVNLSWAGYGALASAVFTACSFSTATLPASIPASG
jgi:hypothetical protein